MSTRAQRYSLGMALYCRIIIDALLDILQDNEVKELKEKMRSVADLVVWLGGDFVPRFKRIKRRWEKLNKRWVSYGYGEIESPLHYEHYLLFEKTVKRHGYQDRLVEIRNGLLSILKPSMGPEDKEKFARDCLDFFVKLEGTCNYAFRQEYFNS